MPQRARQRRTIEADRALEVVLRIPVRFGLITPVDPKDPAQPSKSRIPCMFMSERIKMSETPPVASVIR